MTTTEQTPNTGTVIVWIKFGNNRSWRWQTFLLYDSSDLMQDFTAEEVVSINASTCTIRKLILWLLIISLKWAGGKALRSTTILRIFARICSSKLQRFQSLILNLSFCTLVTKMKSQIHFYSNAVITFAEHQMHIFSCFLKSQRTFLGNISSWNRRS